jgi:hypothetical protein
MTELEKVKKREWGICGGCIHTPTYTPFSLWSGLCSLASTDILTVRRFENLILWEVALSESRKVSWFLWPFVAFWRLVTFILEMTGRFVAILLGIVLIAVGVLVSLTVLGAVVGIPLALFGLLLLFRGLF